MFRVVTIWAGHMCHTDSGITAGDVIALSTVTLLTHWVEEVAGLPLSCGPSRLLMALHIRALKNLDKNFVFDENLTK